MASLFRRREKAQAPARPDLRWADLSGFIGPSYARYIDGSAGGANEAITGSIAVYACVSLLADVIGSLPLHLYRKTADGRERVEYGTGDRALQGRRYPGSLARLLDYPNPEMTGQHFVSTVVGHCALWGNFYAEIIRGDDGRVSELWPLRPDKMEVKRDGDGDLTYRYTIEEDPRLGKRKVVDFPAERILHIPAFGTDGVKGISPIAVARRTIEGESASEQFMNNWYENGATPSTIVTIPKGPPDGANDRAKAVGDTLRQLYGGKRNVGRIAVLEQGIEWNSLSMPMQDMQFIESRKFSLQQIGVLYRIPGYLLNPEVTSTWGSGVEQQFLGMLTMTLRPILVRIENAVDRSLGLVPGEKTLGDENLYAEFQTAELLRTDTKTRMEAYEVAIRSHVLLPNEARMAENLPAIEGGDEFPTLQGQADTAPAEESAEPTAEDNAREAAWLALAHRMAEPVQQTIPGIEVTQPAVNVFNRQLEEGELLSFAQALPQPVVDLKPVAKVLAEAEARRIHDAEKAEERHAAALAAIGEQMERLAEAVKPQPPVRMVRNIERDKAGNLVRVIDEPQEATG
jgi:HK97 family phage portal protein